MKHYMIVCQFHNMQLSSHFLNALDALDANYQNPINNVWYINSHHSIDNIQQHLLSVIEINDSLVISEIQEQRQYTPQDNLKISYKTSPATSFRQRLFA